MGNKLYIGNLPFTVTNETLSEVFSDCGTVQSARIIVDRESGRSKGFGFVEMSTDAEAQACIGKYNGSDWDGRAMTVNEAKPMAPRDNNRGGGNRGGGSRW
jgi:cold-inducible RNA-binding protein